jgi:hypothetical protein
MIQGDQFGGANEGEVQRIEHHGNVFALGPRGERIIIDNAAIAQNGGGGEIGGLLAYQYAHSKSPLVSKVDQTISETGDRPTGTLTGSEQNEP